MIGLTLLEVRYKCKVLPGCQQQQSINFKQFYFILFNDKVIVHQRKFPHLTLDVSLDDNQFYERIEEIY